MLSDIILLKKGLAKKAMIVGLDGARWDYVKRFVDEGKLPNIAKLMSF